MRTPVNERVAVTLVGCLQGTQEPGAAATTGSDAGERARARANGGAADSQLHGRAATAQYTLVDATVESGGVGANGAGGSGGPLLSPDRPLNWTAYPLTRRRA
jgi:hypothetical protein